MKTVIARRVTHDGVQRISLVFTYDPDLISIVKTFPGARWSSSMRYWHVPDSIDTAGRLSRLFSGKAFLDHSNIRYEKTGRSDSADTGGSDEIFDKPEPVTNMEPGQISESDRKDIERYRRWLEAGRFPETTIRTYTSMLEKFLRFVSPKGAREVTSDDIVRIVDEFILPNGLSYSYQNQMISAVKKFYSVIYRNVIEPGAFSRPRRIHRLPNVLSKEEVKKILDSLTNEKHRVMLSLVYGCGLRRSEVLDLLLPDLDRDRNLIHIRQSKGFRDRLVPVSEKLVRMVDQYILHYRPVKYLFEGFQPGSRYSEASIEKVFRTAYNRAGIRKSDITLHGLRHSYATHLLESGTDLRYIQALLGHKSSRTTEIYTHVTIHSIEKIRSPFDDL